ncbi:MAG TPA: glycosyltransferase family A protein [Candidatus Acidoferrales bacterium]|nr:glycosyltransferase family A protein [Candidatus Acidoferrales bacterium]
MPSASQVRDTRQSSASPAAEVSVIIPAYNVSKYIGEALDSVFKQTFQGFEVIVVNDGSPDTEQLERVLENYHDRILYLTQEHKGLAGARNTAIRAARGNYVALLDADDFWEPEYLAVQLDYLHKNPDMDVVSCNSRFFGDKTYAGRTFMDVFPSDGPVTFESLVTRKCNVFVSVTARREAIEQSGLFDESLMSCEDYDLWLRLAADGRRIGYHRKVLVNYRRHEASLSADPVWMAERNSQVIEKWQRDIPPVVKEWWLLEERRTRNVAEANYWRARQAFARGDVTTAVECFKKANEVLRSPKLKGTIFCLQTMPNLALRAHKIKRKLKSIG